MSILEINVNNCHINKKIGNNGKLSYYVTQKMGNYVKFGYNAVTYGFILL